MAKEKSLVEEAIIQMKNLEEAVAENAKGILASTMKEEIKELVKESLSEQEDDEIEVDTEVDMEEPETDDMDDMDDDSELDMDTDELEIDMDDMDDDSELDMDMDMDDDTIDLTDEDDDDEILRVFSLASPEDNIVVVKDGAGNINLKDDDKEYMIVGEGDEDYELDEMEDVDYTGDMDEMYDDLEEEESIDDIVEKVFGNERKSKHSKKHMDVDFEDDFEDDIVYEIEMDDDDDMEEGDMYEMEDMEEGDVEEFDPEDMMESKMTVKPKGVGMGSPNKRKVYTNKPNMDGGFKTVKKKVNKTMGTGKAKFEYKEGENLEGNMKPVKRKVETKEAARTYGKGSKSGRGLRKAITPNRNLTFENTTAKEVQILREKNDEYRKALNVFRNKLNEVAVFNSNLAYATRLFTEHSTSKQEKINILRRFDGVESLKESKSLYKIIKDELSVKTSQPMNESIERKIENTQVSGSAVNLIESKTYENPQFLRMKDLMNKIK
jgi:hypothetical protein